MALRYAEAMDYGLIFSCEKLIAGVDTAGAGTTLTDAAASFLSTERLTAGMPVYNITAHLYGKIVTVADTTLVTTINWTLGDSYQIAKMDIDTVALVESYLRIAAGDINAARYSAGAGDCTVSDDMDMFLRKLNVIDAAIWHNCPCARPNLSDGTRQGFLLWITDTLNQIRTGEIELCQGYTGSSFPAISYAQVAWTPWRAAEIVIDRLLSTP